MSSLIRDVRANCYYVEKMSKIGAVYPSLLNKCIPDRSLKTTTAELSVEETTSKD